MYRPSCPAAKQRRPGSLEKGKGQDAVGTGGTSRKRGIEKNDKSDGEVRQKKGSPKCGTNSAEYSDG